MTQSRVVQRRGERGEGKGERGERNRWVSWRGRVDTGKDRWRPVGTGERQRGVSSLDCLRR